MTRHHPLLYEVRFFGTFVQRFRAVPSTLLARAMSARYDSSCLLDDVSWKIR